MVIYNKNSYCIGNNLQPIQWNLLMKNQANDFIWGPLRESEVGNFNTIEADKMDQIESLLLGSVVTDVWRYVPFVGWSNGYQVWRYSPVNVSNLPDTNQYSPISFSNTPNTAQYSEPIVFNVTPNCAQYTPVVFDETPFTYQYTPDFSFSYPPDTYQYTPDFNFDFLPAVALYEYNISVFTEGLP